jgi:hypothetical protein
MTLAKHIGYWATVSPSIRPMLTLRDKSIASKLSLKSSCVYAKTLRVSWEMF